MARRNKRRGGLMGRSDIPYAQRLRLKRNLDIGWSRERAAKVSMWCYSVALHECEGVGYKRLTRFAIRFKEIDDEFYAMEPELAMEHAKRRMADMGVSISGEFFCRPVPGATAGEQAIHDNALQASQIALLCGAMAANDVFGFGRERQERINERTRELSARYAREGEGFLLEEMEKLGFQVENGTVAAFLDHTGAPVRVKNRKE